MHSSLQTIRGKLSTVRTAVRALYIADGLLRLALVVLGLALASFALDRLIMFPWAMRAVALALMAGAAAVAAGRFVLFPARVPITVEDVAAQVERANPFLKDRLITALQLERLVATDDYADSVQLTRAVIREAEELAGGIRFFRILRPQPVLLLLLVTVAAYAGAFGAATQWSRPVKVWALRNVMLADLDWPRANEVYLVRRALSVGPLQPVELTFLLESGELDGDVELRVLERPAEGLDAGGEGADGERTVRGARRVLADGPDADQVDGDGVLVYRETRVALTRSEGPDGPQLVAKLPPSVNPRWVFLRSERVYRAPLLSLSTEEVRSPLYKLEPTEAKDQTVAAHEIPYPDRDIYVPRGHTLKLDALVFGPIADAIVQYRLGSDATLRRAPMVQIEGQNLFVFEDFNEVRERIELWLAAGDRDATGEPYRVRVRVPPRVADHRVDVRYPSYLGMEPDPAQATGLNFLGTPLGSTLALRVAGEFARPQDDGRGAATLAEPFAATLRFDNQALTPIALKQLGEPQPVPGQPERVRVEFGGELTAHVDTSFFFVLRGPNRLTNENPRYFQLTVVDDRAPEVSLERPSSGQSYKASRDAAIRFVITASDDHGLRRVVVRYKVGAAKTYTERVLKEAKHPYSRQYEAGTAPTDEPKKQRFEFTWELEDIEELEVDQRLYYHLMVEDYASHSRDADGHLVVRDQGQRTYRYLTDTRPAPDPETSDFQLEIVSKLAVEKAINERLFLLREQLLKLLKKQRTVLRTTKTYTENKAFSAEDLDQLFKLELDQNDVTREMQDYVRAPLIEIQELFRENHLTPATNVGEMIRLASRVHLDLSPRAAKLLKEPQAFSDAARQTALLTESLGLQERVVADIVAMLKEMEKFADLAEVISDAQALLELQKTINKDTKALRKR